MMRKRTHAHVGRCWLFVTVLVSNLNIHVIEGSEYYITGGKSKWNQIPADCHLATPTFTVNDDGDPFVDIDEIRSVTDGLTKAETPLWLGYTRLYANFEYIACNDLSNVKTHSYSTRAFSNNIEPGICYSVCQSEYFGITWTDDGSVCYCYGDERTRLERNTDCCWKRDDCSNSQRIATFQYSMTTDASHEGCLYYDPDDKQFVNQKDCNAKYRNVCMDWLSYKVTESDTNMRTTWMDNTDNCFKQELYPVYLQQVQGISGGRVAWTDGISSKMILPVKDEMSVHRNLAYVDLRDGRISFTSSNRRKALCIREETTTSTSTTSPTSVMTTTTSTSTTPPSSDSTASTVTTPTALPPGTTDPNPTTMHSTTTTTQDAKTRSTTNGNTTDVPEATTKTRDPPHTDTAAASTGSDTGTAVGVSVGAVVIVIVAIVTVLLLRKRGMFPSIFSRKSTGSDPTTRRPDSQAFSNATTDIDNYGYLVLDKETMTTTTAPSTRPAQTPHPTLELDDHDNGNGEDYEEHAYHILEKESNGEAGRQGQGSAHNANGGEAGETGQSDTYQEININDVYSEIAPDSLGGGDVAMYAEGHYNVAHAGSDITSKGRGKPKQNTGQAYDKVKINTTQDYDHVDSNQGWSAVTVDSNYDTLGQGHNPGDTLDTDMYSHINQAPTRPAPPTDHTYGIHHAHPVSHK